MTVQESEGGGAEARLPEPKWLSWVAERPGWVATVLTTAGTLIGGWAFSLSGAWLWVCLIGGGVLLLSGFGLVIYQDSRRKQIESFRRIQRKDDIGNLLTELNVGSRQAVDSIDQRMQKKERDRFIAAARTGILNLVRYIIGPENGVRVNLFEVTSQDPPELRAARMGQVGNLGHPSTRVFTADDLTFQMALIRRGRLVRDTSLLDDDRDLNYGSFAVAPISTASSLYGLLTIDTREKHALSEFDQELLTHFGLVLTQTFAADRDALFIDITGAGSKAKIDGEAENRE